LRTCKWQAPRLTPYCCYCTKPSHRGRTSSLARDPSASPHFTLLTLQSLDIRICTHLRLLNPKDSPRLCPTPAHSLHPRFTLPALNRRAPNSDVIRQPASARLFHPLQQTALRPSILHPRLTHFPPYTTLSAYTPWLPRRRIVRSFPGCTLFSFPARRPSVLLQLANPHREASLRASSCEITTDIGLPCIGLNADSSSAPLPDLPPHQLPGFLCCHPLRACLERRTLSIWQETSAGASPPKEAC
jgi:hypothetical protein